MTFPYVSDGRSLCVAIRRERGADILLLAEVFLKRFSAEEGKVFSGFERRARVYAGVQPEHSYSVEPFWMTEKKAIERAIALCRGNITAAAEFLEINASTIYRKKTTWEKLDSSIER